MARQPHGEPAKEKRMNNHIEGDNNSSLDLITNITCFYTCVCMSSYIYISVYLQVYIYVD